MTRSDDATPAVRVVAAALLVLTLVAAIAATVLS